MVNRSRRRGVVVAEWPVDRRHALAEVYDRWLASRVPDHPMRWLIGTPGFEEPGPRRYIVAHVDGRVQGFCTLLPSTLGTWAIDVMCRLPDATPGVMEAMIHHVAEGLAAQGAQWLSLGPCPMAGLQVEGRHRLLYAIFGWLYGSAWGNRLFGFQNLYAFKEKFRPQWRPVYFGAAPRLGVWALYRGCRMWGLL